MLGSDAFCQRCTSSFGYIKKGIVDRTVSDFGCCQKALQVAAVQLETSYSCSGLFERVSLSLDSIVVYQVLHLPSADKAACHVVLLCGDDGESFEQIHCISVNISLFRSWAVGNLHNTWITLSSEHPVPIELPHHCLQGSSFRRIFARVQKAIPSSSSSTMVNPFSNLV